MKLREYIDSSEDKAAARKKLARDIGVEEVTVRSWANGNRYPRREYWQAIVDGTNGAVSFRDLATG